jgi:hypothetical protein
LSAKQLADRDHPILDREIGHATAIGRRSPADDEPRRRLAEIPVRPRWNRVIGIPADPSSLARPIFRTQVRPDDVGNTSEISFACDLYAALHNGPKKAP